MSEDAQSPELAPAAAPQAQPPNVHNGTYTVEHPQNGHFTLKLYTAQNGNLAGKRILAMLVGPDNETNYRGVAFWNESPNVGGPVAHVWKRFRGPRSHLPIDGYHWQSEGWSSIEQKLAIWSDLALRGDSEDRHGYWFGSGYRLLLEGRCVVCNRKLTDPESIRTGIGPVCGGRA